MKRLFFFGLLIFLVSTSLGWTDVETWLKPMPTRSDESEPEEPSLSEGEQAPPKEVIFSFLQEFHEAKARKFQKGKFIGASWVENGFQFEDSTYGGNMKDIFLSEQISVNGRQRMAIWFLINPGFESLLLFQNVPPGRQLRLFYALPDGTFLQKAPAFIQVEVWIGRKKLFKAQINTKGWKQKTVNWVLPFLLHRDCDVTIAIRSLNPEPNLLGVYGNIE